MSTRDNAPPPPEWQPEPRPCPMPCGICTTAPESAWMHNAGERLVESEPDWVRLIDEQGTN